VIDWNVRIRFTKGVDMIFQAWGDSPETDPRLARTGNYAQIIGTDGWIALSYMGLITEPESLIRSVIGPQDVHLPRSRGHEANFIECVRTRGTPVDPVEEAVRSDLVSQVSDIAIRLGRKVIWDPIKEEFVGDDEANRMRSRALREPWTL
jgi:hypothetical protein